MRDSVPSASYSSVCNVLHQWSISLIPTYRVYRLYDINIYICPVIYIIAGQHRYTYLVEETKSKVVDGLCLPLRQGRVEGDSLSLQHTQRHRQDHCISPEYGGATCLCRACMYLYACRERDDKPFFLLTSCSSNSSVLPPSPSFITHYFPSSSLPSLPVLCTPSMHTVRVM